MGSVSRELARWLRDAHHEAFVEALPRVGPYRATGVVWDEIAARILSGNSPLGELRTTSSPGGGETK